MCVGKIVEIGDAVEGFEIGERVANHGHLKETHTWRAGSVLKMPDQMTWKEAVCYDPTHFAMSAIRDGKVRVGERVARLWAGCHWVDDRYRWHGSQGRISSLP